MAGGINMNYNDKNIETYLTDLVLDKLFPFEGEVFWNKKAYTFEIYGTIFADNTKRLSIVDVDEVVSSEEVMDFSDGVCFYDESHPVEPSEFLYTIPFNRKTGIEKKEMLGLVSYFVDVLTKGQEDLDAFINSDQDVFELVFDKEKFKEKVAEFDSEKGSVPYPKF